MFKCCSGQTEPADKSIEAIAELIREGRCRRIITMAGAGLSTAAGIPDFRSPDLGIYHRLSEYHLTHAEQIFDIDYFRRNPEPFFRLCKELLPGDYKPTLSHYFIKLICDKKLLLRHYSQNIDGLEREAGLPDGKLVEAHGTFRSGHCLKCRERYEFPWLRARILADTVPNCERCQSVVKPDVVLFGEPLSRRFLRLVRDDFPRCELLLVLGTSLEVQPFASLAGRVRRRTPRLLINRTQVRASRGLRFDDPSYSSDVAWYADCDAGCKQLASLLGWTQDLQRLVGGRARQ